MEVWIAAAFMAFLVAVGVFDLYAIFAARDEETVSQVIYQWAQRWPIIPFLAGMIAGHLFFPTVGPHR